MRRGCVVGGVALCMVMVVLHATYFSSSVDVDGGVAGVVLLDGHDAVSTATAAPRVRGGGGGDAAASPVIGDVVAVGDDGGGGGGAGPAVGDVKGGGFSETSVGGATGPSRRASRWGNATDVINGTVVVVARNMAMYTGPLTWLDAQPYRYVPITYGQPEGTPNNVPFDKGREASAYLRYILDYWDDLPPRVIFIHDHDKSWHVDRHFGVCATMCVRRCECIDVHGAVCIRRALVEALTFPRPVASFFRVLCCAVVVCDAERAGPTVVRVRVAEL
jgi:hypothetical protein